MPRPIVMPSLGMYTTEGTVTAWLREPGSQVAAGEPVVEVTTEKAVYQVEAPGDGILHAVAEVGAVVPDQGLIGHVLAPGEAPPVAEAPQTAAAGPVGGARPASPTLAPAPRPPGGELRASPAARRLAQDRGVDITTVVGTGPGGRIVEADVMAAIAPRSAPPAPAPPDPVRPTPPAPTAPARNLPEQA